MEKVSFWRPLKTVVSCDLFIIRELVGLQHAVPPTNTKFKPLFLPTQAGMPYTNTHKHRTSYFKSTLTLLGSAKHWKSISAARQKPEIFAFLHHQYNNQRVGSTLYIGMAHPAPLTNTNFQITFLLTRLLEALYMKTYQYRASNLKSTVTFLASVSLRKSISGYH